jgi:hypothetical protein
VAQKTLDPQAMALESLAQAIADPTPKLLAGAGKTPGFFKGRGPAVQAAIRLCEERQWLAPTGQFSGKGRSQKPLYAVTAAGLQAVLSQSEPVALLRKQQELLTGVRGVLDALARRLEPLEKTLGELNRKMEPPDLQQVLAKLSPAPGPPARPPDGAPPNSDWLEEVISLVRQQRERDRYQPLTLPELYAKLQQARPGLTLGQFHDGLRTLREKGRLRLTPYTRALATLPDPRNALFLDGEVMYYAELP